LHDAGYEVHDNCSGSFSDGVRRPMLSNGLVTKSLSVYRTH
jgi:hypothetical protein